MKLPTAFGRRAIVDEAPTVDIRLRSRWLLSTAGPI